MNEIKIRGLERELSNMIKNKEERKNKAKNSVTNLSQEALFNIVLFNIDHYTEDDLTIFKNEIDMRGLSEELSNAQKAKEAEDTKFKNEVLDGSKSTEELLDSFNQFMSPDNTQTNSVAENQEETNSSTRIIIGVVILILLVILVYLAS